MGVVGSQVRFKENIDRLMVSRIFVGVICVFGLASVFLFQRIDIAEFLGVETIPINKFLINRTIRFLLNDAFAIGLIYSLFRERKYIIFSLYVQLAGMVLVLFPYFVLKIYWPRYNGPLISFLHRLVLNPTLLMLLIPAFYYQKKVKV